MKIVYAVSAYYPDVPTMRNLGTLDSEEEARRYCAHYTKNCGGRKSMKIVRQEAGANSGEVIAFYKGGVEVDYKETIA